jgi:AcrR family transcriptional regulator
MRTRDEVKQDAIIEATIKLVNEIGFASGSVAKIAREAGVSPATIYIYYKNKEDLLVSTYKAIKIALSQALMKRFDASRPIRDILQVVWQNGFDYISHHAGYFQFTEQFANSPYAALADSEEIDRHYLPLMNVLQSGIEQKIIKNVPLEILIAFVFYPIMTLTNARLHGHFRLEEAQIELAFGMAWDAIKL